MRMKQRARRGYTLAELEEVWDRWKRGESLKSIGRVFGKQPSSVYHQACSVRRHPSSATTPFMLGTDVVGARRDLSRHCGTSIDTIHRRVAGSLTIDGEPGDSAEWRR